MKDQTSNKPSPQPIPANLSESELVSNQGAEAVPWFVGTRLVSVKWISPVYDLYHKPAAGTGKKSSGGKSGKSGGGQLYDYFGTIAGVICAGPLDEIVALAADGSVIWPTNNYWADGIVGLPVISASVQSVTIKTTSGKITTVSAYDRARIQFNVAHSCKAGQKIVLQGFVNSGGFNFSELNGGPYTIDSVGDYTIDFTLGGSPTAIPLNTPVPSGTGNMTKSVAYTVGVLVVFDGAVYTCALNHQSSTLNEPPNATYWTAFAATRGSNPNPYHFTISGRNNVSGATYNYGDAYLYWGTSAQTLDAVGEAMLTQQGHPPYRNQAVLVLKNFFFGTQMQAAPNVQVLVRKTPGQTLIGGAPANLDGDYQANPMAALASLVTDTLFGIGQVNALMDATTWGNVATYLYGIASDSYLTIYLDKDMTMRQFVAQVLAYFDGWALFSAGIIQAGYFLHNGSAPAFTAATTINYNDVVDEIEWDADGWAPTFNETLVKFQDKDRAWKDASELFASQFNRQVVGEPRRQTLDRPWISRDQQASDYAAEFGKIAAVPELSGTLKVRAEKCASITPGSLFLLTHDALQYSVVCRCLERTMGAPPSGIATLRFANERGLAPVPYHPTPASPTNPTLPAGELVALYQLLQCPIMLAPNNNALYCIALCARRSALTRGVNAWFRQADAANFYELGSQTGWAVAGILEANVGITPATSGLTLNTSNNGTISALGGAFYGTSICIIEANLTSGATPPVSGSVVLPGGSVTVSGCSDARFDAVNPLCLGIQFLSGTLYRIEYYIPGAINQSSETITGSVTYTPPLDAFPVPVTIDDFTLADDLAAISETQTLDAQGDSALLMFIVSAGTGDLEICTVTGITLVSGVYEVSVLRGQYGTVAQAFSAGDYVWLQYRDTLMAYSQNDFLQDSINGLQGVFRLQSFTDRGLADLTDATQCPDIDFTFANVFEPTITWFSQQEAAANSTTFSASTYYYLAEPSASLTAGGSTFNPGNQFQISFGLQALPGTTIASAQVNIQGPQGKQTVWSEQFQNGATMASATAQFSLTYDGVYRVYVNVELTNGMTFQYELPPYTGGGGSQETVIYIVPVSGTLGPYITPSAPALAAEYFANTSLTDLTITLQTDQAGAVIHYQVVALGAQPVGGSYINSGAQSVSVQVPVSKLLSVPLGGSGGVTVWFYSVHSATNSSVQYQDYYIATIGTFKGIEK